MRAWARARSGLSLPGCWAALVLACLSFVPSLVPRPAAYQGAVTGLSAAIGYGVGVLAAWLWREVADRPARPGSPVQWKVLGVAAPVLLVVALVLGAGWQRQAAALLRMEPEPAVASVLVLPVGVLIVLAIIGLARLVRLLIRAVGSALSRLMGARAARVVGAGVVVVAVALLFNGVILDRVAASVNAVFALTNGGTPEGLSAPTSPLRSGSPESLIGWETLGLQGRAFVGQGPDAREIAAVAEQAGGGGEPTTDPVRIYAGLDSAPDLESRAALAVQDLDRAGGFERAQLLVVTTTGTGWVEPTSVTAFEHLTGGDSAIVSMQYSFLPSPLSFLADRQKARSSGRALFDAVYERWSRLPAGQRPDLYVYGESLGSYGAEAAFSGEFDMENRLSGAVFTGPPRFNLHFREFLDDRDLGTPEIQPGYRQGRTVRFTLDPRDPAAPVEQPWEGARVLYMLHPSDAITWWDTDLILQRPDWLEEPRGPDVLDQVRWVPFVTFWQLTADMGLSMEPGPGYGHNFSGEHVDAWAQVLGTDGWSTRRAEAVRNAVLAGSGEPFTPVP